MKKRATWLAGAGVAVLVLVAAGCGSSSSAASTSSTHHKMHHMMGGNFHPMAMMHATLTVKKTHFGETIFAADGRVLYVFGADKGSTSHCYGVCAKAWPPFLSTSTPHVMGMGLKQSLIGVTMRTDGTHQVTYAGHPLYYYSGDSVGSVKCQHVNLHGGLWLILEANGHPNMMMGSGM